MTSSRSSIPRPTRLPARAATALLAASIALAGCQARDAANTAGDDHTQGSASGTSATSATPAAANPVERGRYLVTIAGCNDCHTPLVQTAEGPRPDMSRMLSGHPASLVVTPPPQLPPGPWIWSGTATLTAFAGPWGISYASNLTPHPTTGLGAEVWTEEIFIAALRTGKHFGTSRPIMPPMPWASIAQMSDEDLKAVYAYLRTIPPIDNLVPDYAPPAGP